jgi:pyridoxamine 5'-phosphate oxidase
VLDLQKNPQAEILFYDPLTEIQLKCFGGAKIIHTGPSADAAWEKVPESSKKQYTSLLAPGTVIENTAAVEYRSISHFCIITLETEGIEYLKLGNPHQRIRWSLKNGVGILENLVP